LPLSAEAGTFQGDNGPIAYTCGGNVCVVNPDGSNAHTLISGATDPSYSPGELFDPVITYVTSTGIGVADDDGTFPAVLATNGATAASQPTTSFNGNDVAYANNGDIFAIETDTTGSPRNLSSAFGTTDSDPAYSPGGTQLAYIASGQVRILSNLTSSPATRNVTDPAIGASSPSWSPDGATIAYAAGGKIFRIPSSSTSGTGTALANGSDPVWSPDGTTILFVDGAGHLATVPSGGGTSTELPGAITGTDPDWQEIDIASTAAPTNLSYPKVNLAAGDTQPVVGHFLTASVGSWDGAFPIGYTYQWKRCDAADVANGPCVEITGATSSFYTPTSLDAGKRLRVQVTATNSKGSASQNSEATEIVIAVAPKVRSTPAINGGNTVDSPLTLTAGLWDGSTPITFTYSWRRCNAQGDLATCVQIPGATLATYTPTSADIGSSIRVWITGTNPQGSDTAVTNHTFPVVDKPHFAPTAATSPLVGGTAGIGRQLTANVGSYDGDAPIATQFAWQRCDATGGSCRAIPSAKKVVYFPTAKDVGYTLRINVTATNAYGKMTLQSSPTEPIAMLPPHIKGRHIVGTARADYKAGGGHDDTIEGLSGNDTLLGGAGDDVIEGGGGNDIITGGSGADKLFGGAGSDTIYAADGERDTIDCGAGRDRVVADDVDKTVNCEVVSSGPGSTEPPPASSEPGARRR
jgi:Ca2+-binding RTX toxin-like protein